MNENIQITNSAYEFSKSLEDLEDNDNDSAQ